MNSAVYEGWVAHRRTSPVEHGFRYRIYLPLLDVDELPDLFDRFPLWSARRAAPVRFRREDFLGDPDRSLADAARDLVHERTGRRPAGRVELLAAPRYLGVGFNPVSFLFCRDRDERLDAIVAEVTNTPWGERHAYVLDPTGRPASVDATVRGSFAKRMHVSPFMGMDQRYEWWATAPSDRLRIGFRNVEQGRPIFTASLALERREMTRRLMTRLLLTYPPMTIATLTRIYAHALRLRLKGAPYYRHAKRDSGRRPSARPEPTHPQSRARGVRSDRGGTPGSDRVLVR